MWSLDYDFVVYGTFQFILDIDIANFYNLKFDAKLEVFKISLIKQYIRFIHPHTMLVRKFKNEEVTPFNLGLMTDFEVQKLLNLTIAISDSMKANFEKELDDLVTEVINFAFTSTFGDEDYVPPEDDTKNIANGANWLPSASDFSSGAQVFTNDNTLQPVTTY